MKQNLETNRIVTGSLFITLVEIDPSRSSKYQAISQQEEGR